MRASVWREVGIDPRERCVPKMGNVSSRSLVDCVAEGPELEADIAPSTRAAAERLPKSRKSARQTTRARVHAMFMILRTIL